MRHFPSRTPTPNNLNQLLAIKLGRVQIGAFSGRAWIAMAIAVHAVAELAVRLFMKQAIAKRSGLRGCDYRQHSGDSGDGKLESQSPVFLHRFELRMPEESARAAIFVRQLLSTSDYFEVMNWMMVGGK
jgi:hypothetical protein